MEKYHSAQAFAPKKDTYMDILPWASLYLHAKYSFDVEGLDALEEGPAMYVGNHLRVDDSLIFASFYARQLGKPLRFGAKSEYFHGGGLNDKGLLGWPIQKFVEDTQQIPVYREDNRKGAVSLAKDIKHRFDIGESVLLHAEGTRSKDGRLNKFKHGAAAFAIKNSVPIVPVSVQYDDRRFYQRTHVKVTFGEPLTPQVYGMKFHHYPIIPDGLVDAVVPRIMKQSERVARVTSLLEDRIAAMSGQEQSGIMIDPYANKK